MVVRARERGPGLPHTTSQRGEPAGPPRPRPGGGLVVVTAQQLGTAQQQLTRETRARQATSDLQRQYVEQETGLRGYLLTGEVELLAPYELAQRQLPGVRRELREGLRAVGGDAAQLEVLEQAHAEWDAYAREQIAAVGRGERTGPSSIGTTMLGKTLFDDVRSAGETLDAQLEGLQEASQRETHRLQTRLVVSTAGGLAALALLLGLGSLVTVRQVTQPLRRLAEATRRVADGDLSAQLRAEGASEVRELAGDVAAMRDRLLADLDRTRQALGALDQEDRAVRAVRQALLPSPAGWRACGSRPASTRPRASWPATGTTPSRSRRGAWASSSATSRATAPTAPSSRCASSTPWPPPCAPTPTRARR